MSHAFGTIGPFFNNSSTRLQCDDDPFKALPSFDSAAYVSRVTFATILAVLILPTIFLNITIIIAIIKNRTLWRSSQILIGFLAVTDTLVGVFSMPLLLFTVLIEIIYERSSHSMEVYCILIQAALNAGDLCIGWSFITVVVITFERYVAIFAPFWYRKYVQTSVVVKATLVIWVIWAAAVVILILNISLEFAVGVVILILVLMVYVLAVPAYIRVLYLLKKMESSPLRETDSRPTIDRKGSITCAIMLFCLVLCYTPLFVASLVLVVKGESKTLLTYIIPWVRLGVLANSFFNPIIYICRIALIRKSAKNIFKRFCWKSSPQRVTSFQSAPAVELGANNRAAVISQDSKL